MATSLKLTFGTSGDKKLSLTYPYATPFAAPAQVKTLMQRIVADGAIYADAPVGIVAAELIDRTVTPINVG